MTLECRDVVVSFGGRVVLAGASLTVGSGQVVGLLGSNGAGKSVLLDVIGGFVQPDSGEVLMHSKRLPRNLDASRRAHLGLSRLFQRGEMPSNMPAGKLLALAARSATAMRAGEPLSLAGTDWWHFLTWRWWQTPLTLQLAPPAAIALGLEKELGKDVESLSEGQQRRLALATVICRRPAFALLDEPVASLDESGRAAVGAQIRELAIAGAGVLVVEHDLAFLKSIADSVAWLSQGRCTQDASADLLGSASFRRSAATS